MHIFMFKKRMLTFEVTVGFLTFQYYSLTNDFIKRSNLRLKNIEKQTKFDGGGGKVDDNKEINS